MAGMTVAREGRTGAREGRTGAKEGRTGARAGRTREMGKRVPRGTRPGPGGGREGLWPGTATSSTRQGTGGVNDDDYFNYGLSLCRWGQKERSPVSRETDTPDLVRDCSLALEMEKNSIQEEAATE